MTHSVNLLAGPQHLVSLQRLSSLHPLQEDVVKRWFNAVEQFLAAERPAYHLEEYRVSWGRFGTYGDDVVGESLELQADLVIPAWPAPEVAAKLPLQDSSIGETLEHLLSFERCLKPRSEWPATPPREPRSTHPRRSGSASSRKGTNWECSTRFTSLGSSVTTKGRRSSTVPWRSRRGSGTRTARRPFSTNSCLRRLRDDGWPPFPHHAAGP